MTGNAPVVAAPAPAGKAGWPIPIRVPAFVVVGGAEAGVFYVRQLGRAMAAGRLDTDRILVLDRDPACAAAAFVGGPVRLEVAEWSDWLDEHLDLLDAADHLVPYHWAPHLLLEWLIRRARRAGARVSRGGEIPPQGVPWERDTRAGDRAVSYATWTCPPTCIEPALCPHTGGRKDWSLAGDLRGSRPADPFDVRIVFHCLHLTYGVGTIPVAEIQAAGRRVVDGIGSAPRRYLVATSSHCHALAAVMEVAG